MTREKLFQCCLLLFHVDPPGRGRRSRGLLASLCTPGLTLGGRKPRRVRGPEATGLLKRWRPSKAVKQVGPSGHRNGEGHTASFQDFGVTLRARYVTPWLLFWETLKSRDFATFLQSCQNRAKNDFWPASFVHFMHLKFEMTAFLERSV